MNKTAWACAMALATLGTLDAHAQVYGELGYTSASVWYELFDSKTEFSQKALRGVVGYELTPNLAVEGQATFGVGNNSMKDDGQTVPDTKARLDSVFGVYVKPKTKLGDKVEVFGRVGNSRNRISTTEAGVGTTYSDTAVSLGAGLSYALTPAASLNIDYMQSLQTDLTRSSGLTIGVGYKF